MKSNFLFYMSLLTFLIIYGCKKEEHHALPVLSTSPVTEITTTSAKSGGIITYDGNAQITERGICWSIAAEPAISDSKTSDGPGIGGFESSMTGLSVGNIYHVRAYATNAAGTAYGEEVTFSTLGDSPSAITRPAIYVSTTLATLNGNVNANYSPSTVTFEYGTTTSYGNVSPVDQSPVTGNIGTDVSSKIISLTTGTNYHYRVKAVNALGTTYGEDMTFSTTNIATDADGNVYNTVLIGTQVWMAENLKTTKYNDGSPIANVTDAGTWFAMTTDAYCDYANDPSYSETYGRLYNWYVVDVSNPKNVCPAGWHVSTDLDWTILAVSVGGEDRAGGFLKEMGTTHWMDPNVSTNNENGFTALPGGTRGYNGEFSGSGNDAFWWTSTEYDPDQAWFRNISYYISSCNRGSYWKRDGFSVRCIQD